MIIKLSDYKTSKKSILENYEKYGLDRMLAMYPYTPAIVMYSFLNEKYGGFDKTIKGLVKFYQYSEIIPETEKE